MQTAMKLPVDFGLIRQLEIHVTVKQEMTEVDENFAEYVFL